jgi:hypothetical protein
VPVLSGQLNNIDLKNGGFKMVLDIMFPSDLSAQVTRKYNELVRILKIKANGWAVGNITYLSIMGSEAADFVEILQEEISIDEITIIERADNKGVIKIKALAESFNELMADLRREGEAG